MSLILGAYGFKEVDNLVAAYSSNYTGFDLDVNPNDNDDTRVVIITGTCGFSTATYLGVFLRNTADETVSNVTTVDGTTSVLRSTSTNNGYINRYSAQNTNYDSSDGRRLSLTMHLQFSTTSDPYTNTTLFTDSIYWNSSVPKGSFNAIRNQAFDRITKVRFQAYSGYIKGPAFRVYNLGADFQG
ncbi:MAG TPA: hypothetical protein DCM40_13730 [Maribacter sp.]|nr:hypothetical protein [Maribacter sp.]